MHTTAMRRVVVLALTALILAAMVFAGAAAITASVSDEQAGVRVASSPGSREST